MIYRPAMQRHLPKIGIDLVEVARFRPYAKKPSHHFLKKAFSSAEIAYCFQFADPATHLAGLFAAKEAVSKAVGATKYPFYELEIRLDKNGAPEVWRGKRKLNAQISITHTRTMAAAIALV